LNSSPTNLPSPAPSAKTPAELEESKMGLVESTVVASTGEKAPGSGMSSMRA
jgi:hypothetical protein